MYAAKILADSVAPDGTRLTTFEITFPRFILAEFNTHRVFSRNSASSRAIPIPKQIERILRDPFVPTAFGSRKAGMSAGAAITGWKSKVARSAWIGLSRAAVLTAKTLDRLDVHKSYVNRVLEPWMWHTVIVTATEYENFFALRTDENAQPEIQVIAGMMQDLYREATPTNMKPGDIHAPLVTAAERRTFGNHNLALISAGRCARVSFDTQHEIELAQKSHDRAIMLSGNGHWSPLEHQASVAESVEEAKPGNFSGQWDQFRKTFDGEHDFRQRSVVG